MFFDRYHKNADGIWESRDDGQFFYSDGNEVENRLIALLRQAQDVSSASDELQYLISDWPSEYHFSPLRANLLTSFELGKLGSILEVGSGCGALTRVLGENHPQTGVVALEGSARRAEITRVRCRDLLNVEVCRDSFTAFESDDLFGCITMIGVLEYSPSYFKGEDPVLEALLRARRLLRRDGMLVVAIENQLGLKYFNGCTEDHSGQPFTGIHDAYEPGTYRTYGRKHLLEKMRLAGFENVEFVYPFPDYKLPRLLLREDALNHHQFDVSGLVGQYPSRDYTGNTQRLFQESAAWDVLTKNNLIPDLANSFLIFAFTGDASVADVTEPWLGKVYSCPRKKQYLSETVFFETAKGVTVEKRVSFPLEQPTAHTTGPVKHCPARGEFITGTPYSNNFTKQVRGENSCVKFIEYLRPWVDYLRELRREESTSEEVSLPGRLLDCLPSNIIVESGNRLRLFDQEWEYGGNLEPGFLFFRGVYRELSVNMDYLLKYTDLFVSNDGPGNAYGILLRVFEEFNFHLDEKTLDRFIFLEADVQKGLIAYRESREELHDILHSFFMVPRLLGVCAADFFLPGTVEHHMNVQTRQGEESQQLARVAEELISLKRGWSWKIGRIITFIPRRIKKLFLI